MPNSPQSWQHPTWPVMAEPHDGQAGCPPLLAWLATPRSCAAAAASAGTCSCGEGQAALLAARSSGGACSAPWGSPRAPQAALGDVRGLAGVQKPPTPGAHLGAALDRTCLRGGVLGLQGQRQRPPDAHAPSHRAARLRGALSRLRDPTEPWQCPGGAWGRARHPKTELESKGCCLQVDPLHEPPWLSVPQPVQPVCTLDFIARACDTCPRPLPPAGAPRAPTAPRWGLCPRLHARHAGRAIAGGRFAGGALATARLARPQASLLALQHRKRQGTACLQPEGACPSPGTHRHWLPQPRRRCSDRVLCCPALPAGMR